MNNTINSFHFSNAQLYEYLIAFVQTLPKNDATWEPFKTLVEALKFALLNGENPNRLAKRIRRERHRKEPSLTPLSPTQAQLDIAEIKRLQLLAKTKPRIPGFTKLDPYRQEILTLHQYGASQTDIKYWLTAKGVVVSQPTIHRFLATQTTNGQKA